MGLPAAAATTASAPATRPKPDKPVTFETLILQQVRGALDAAESGSWNEARAQLDKTFDHLIAWGTDAHANGFREAAFARRLLHMLNELPAEKRGEWLKFLRQHEQLGHTLVLSLAPQNRPPAVLAVLEKLRSKHEKDLEPFATLTTALCVVHDRPLQRHVNENSAKGTDPVELFAYYTRYEKAMYFGLRNVPPELLIRVVDTTSPVEHLGWALNKHARDDAVGRRFFDIKYDFDHLQKATPKKLTQAGFSLPNILQYGGVCADQAYYASEVGKAVGVPTAVAAGRASTVGHAWVGFLQAKAGQGWWNFDVGRYEEYRGVRGQVENPQTRQREPDAFVSLTAELIGTRAEGRQQGVALCDAAERLFELLKREKEFAAPEVPAAKNTLNVRTKARTASTASILELLELGLRRNAGYARGWIGLGVTAQTGKMTLEQKKYWSEIVLKLCKRYPDFALVALEPMIKTVDDVKEQDRMWSTLFAMVVQTRQDLAAEVRMVQGAMWEEQQQWDKAGLCYMDVIQRFGNATPLVLRALARAEHMLTISQRAEKVPTLYEEAWTRTRKPQGIAGPFAKQSNWYRVGKAYVEKLQAAGDNTKADTVKKQLDTLGK